MAVNEELSENAEHAKEPFDKRVAVTMAIIAALLAIVSVASHIFATDELLAQQKATDQWAYSQAKDIRRYESEIARDVLRSANAEAAAKADSYAANSEMYKKQHDDIQAEAGRLENESELKGRQALRLEIGEIFLEVGIVLASLAILTKRPLGWWASIMSAAIGVGVALSTVLVS